MSPEYRLQEAAVALRRSAPADWERFMVVLGEYNGWLAARLVDAPQNEFALYQGKAMLARDLTHYLREAPTAVEKFRRIQQGKTL